MPKRNNLFKIYPQMEEGGLLRLSSYHYDACGELFVNQQNTFFDTRYKFTAKEHDQESNYTYTSTGSVRRFGARYYDSDLSVWLSVDPMADKYPSLSPYNYCANNPIMLIDPDGREFDPASKEYYKQYKCEIKNRISELKSERNTQGADLDDINLQIKELRQARRELRIMNRSSTMFKIRELTDEQYKHHKTGFTAYDESDNSVYIVFDFYSTLGHEMRHGYGLISGEISYNQGAGFKYSDTTTWSSALINQPGILYDLRDEEAAYKRGWAFMSNDEKASMLGIGKNLRFNDWSIGNNNTQWIYDEYIGIYNISMKKLSIRNVTPELLKNQVLFTKLR